MRELVVIDKLNMGGVTSSLLNYLEYASRYHQIDLLVFSNVVDSSRMPGNIKLLKSPSLLTLFGFSQKEVEEKSKIWGLLRGMMAVGSKLFGGHYIRQILFSFIKSVGDYDVAISYTHDVSWKSLTTGCNDFVLQKVNAKYKISFVHCDYKLFGGYDKRGTKIYNGFNTIVCVSNGCKKSFVECFPALDSKTVVCENFIDIAKINASAEPAEPFINKEFKLVTVCRVEEQKGVYRIIEVAERLKEEGFDNFVWRIVGDGPDLNNIKEKVAETGLEDVIDIVGQQNSPYRFINGATLFVLPSFHEAAPMVFGECRVLGVPVLSTRTTSADELLTERGAGFVCENNTDAIYESVKDVVSGKKTLPIIGEDMSAKTNVQAENDYRLLNDRIERSLS